MTVKEKFKKMLTDRGMLDEQANAVLEKAIKQIESRAPDSKITWDRPAYVYPEESYKIIGMLLLKMALEWIDQNMPQAWFRPMFE